MRGGVIADQNHIMTLTNDFTVPDYHTAERSAMPIADSIQRFADCFCHKRVAGFNVPFCLVRLCRGSKHEHQQNG